MTVTLPHVTGRQYLSAPSALTDWERAAARSPVPRTAWLAIINGQVSSAWAMPPPTARFAPCAPMRAKHAFGALPATLRIWASYSTTTTKVGVRQLGFLSYNTHGYFDGPSASNILSSIAVSKDEKYVAIGGADRDRRHPHLPSSLMQQAARLGG